MQYKKVTLFAVLLSGFGATGLYAQHSVNTTGGTAAGSGGSVSYSVGQMTYHTHNGTQGTLTEGVQQPYEILIGTGLAEAEGIHLLVSAYPNPTTDYLTLKVKEVELSGLSFHLYDMQGRVLQANKLTGTETQIDMSRYAPSTYFVKVFSDDRLVKEFKIIKH